MPEGPELYKASKFVNTVCTGKIFDGKIVKSASSKNPEIDHQLGDYTIQAESCGKEMALKLSPWPPTDDRNDRKMIENTTKHRILFRFGMSGKFQFTTTSETHKHAHLSFFTKGEPCMVLSFVDVRRFGRWEITDTWSKDRGPDPILDYKAFRNNVMDSLGNKAFDKALCEVMHNQKFFNGIGNYLRAEIIYRAGIPPFTSARSVLEKLKIKEEVDVKKEPAYLGKSPDILQFCNTVPSEVIQIPGAGYDPSEGNSDYSSFKEWLQCYSNPNMRNLVDHDGRTMWFKGEAGPLAPKGGKSRVIRHNKKHKAQENESKVKSKEVKSERKNTRVEKTNISKQDAAKTIKKAKTVATSKTPRKRKVTTVRQVKVKPKKVPPRKATDLEKNTRKSPRLNKVDGGSPPKRRKVSQTSQMT